MVALQPEGQKRAEIGNVRAVGSLGEASLPQGANRFITEERADSENSEGIYSGKKMRGIEHEKVPKGENPKRLSS